ncbi:protein spinster homolog 1-like isoform X1 [Lytechinus variegatus]|uniref:protein spinster homolog 1-like isoform X1 n=1 Tax=Lytechinus variegatus TaxID=7654 RepID=UPI001BB1BB01|nr:protein spinster homolog 1-like isoform X1 [Lytechinus variegatus]
MIPPPAKKQQPTEETDDIQNQPSASGNLVEMAATSEWSGDKRPLLREDEGDEDDCDTEVMDFAQRSNLGRGQQNKVNGYDVVRTDTTCTEPDPVTTDPQDKKPPCSAYLTVVVLFCVNLLNYSDRYTIAANLNDIQEYFNITDDNSKAGLLQTIFIVGYMLTSPIFGYLGDRYSRKLLVAFGITTWSGLTLAGSFIPADYFWAFLLLRGLVGIGEASYVTIAATLIGDLFVGNRRTRMLMLFYFAIPVGSGLGYIGGKLVAELAGDWKWALRFTPPLGIVCVILILFLVKEPKRGQAETGEHSMANTSYITDIMALIRNKSYIFSTFGLTTVCWITGALALWAVTAVEDAYKIQGIDPNSVSILFGVVTVVSGFLGVGIGTTIAQLLRRKTDKADPLVCAAGMLLSAPFLFVALQFSDRSVGITWTFVFIAETLICLNWALVPDILLAVLIPTRRSTGNAIQMLISHLLGDALSPYLVGAVSDAIRDSDKDSDVTQAQYTSLIYALYMTCYVTVLGGGFFLCNALYFAADKKRVETIVAKMKLGNNSPQSSVNVDMKD